MKCSFRRLRLRRSGKRRQRKRFDILQYCFKNLRASKAADVADALLKAEPDYVPAMAVRMRNLSDEGHMEEAQAIARQIASPKIFSIGFDGAGPPNTNEPSEHRTITSNAGIVARLTICPLLLGLNQPMDQRRG